jgi:hypothetical protein
MQILCSSSLFCSRAKLSQHRGEGTAKKEAICISEPASQSSRLSFRLRRLLLRPSTTGLNSTIREQSDSLLSASEFQGSGRCLFGKPHDLEKCQLESRVEVVCSTSLFGPATELSQHRSKGTAKEEAIGIAEAASQSCGLGRSKASCFDNLADFANNVDDA